MKAVKGLVLLAFCILASFTLSCKQTPIPHDQPTDYDVIVIGSGMGGLSAGAHLASKGMKVLLLEQHHKVGGCTSSFSRGEFNFDIALHEMAGGGGDSALAQLLKEAGVYDKIELIRIPNLYRAIFPNVDFTYPADMDAAVKALSEKWPEEKEGIEKFHKLMVDINADVMELGDKLFTASRTKMLFTMIQVPFRQPTLFKYYKATLKDVLDKHFKDEELKAVVSQLWVFYGPPPSKLWAPIFLLANHTYLVEGTWHIKGSSQALSDAYAERIVEMGGKVKTGTLVTSIIVENDRVRGVKTELGETYTSRYVVSNADPFQTFFKLVGEDKTPKKLVKKIKSMKPANSIISIYMGLDVEPSFWNTSEHATFYSTSLDADEIYKNMMEGNYDKAACMLTFYTNLGDEWYAPPGKSVLVLAAFSDIKTWPKDREQYQIKKQKIADQLISLAENVFPNLKEHIVVMEVATPRTFEAFTLQKDGIPYGWDFVPNQAMRLPNTTPIDGLYLAGSWTSPGHGVGTAQISGYQAARLILDREGVE